MKYESSSAFELQKSLEIKLKRSVLKSKILTCPSPFYELDSSPRHDLLNLWKGQDGNCQPPTQDFFQNNWIFIFLQNQVLTFNWGCVFIEDRRDEQIDFLIFNFPEMFENKKICNHQYFFVPYRLIYLVSVRARQNYSKISSSL